MGQVGLATGERMNNGRTGLQSVAFTQRFARTALLHLPCPSASLATACCSLASSGRQRRARSILVAAPALQGGHPRPQFEDNLLHGDRLLHGQTLEDFCLVGNFDQLLQRGKLLHDPSLERFSPVGRAGMLALMFLQKLRELPAQLIRPCIQSPKVVCS